MKKVITAVLLAATVLVSVAAVAFWLIFLSPHARR